MPPASVSAVCSSSRSSLSRLSFSGPAAAVDPALHLRREVAERPPPVADDLAEEQVLPLDRRRALVEGVDLGVAHVLLERVVLDVARPAERLQRLGAQQHPGTFRAVPLDHGQQQVVEPDGGLVDLALGAGQRDPVLHARGEEDERAQALGAGLLRHQRTTDVGVVDDRHARRGLVGRVREVGSLHPLLRVRERVQVAAGQGRDRLGPDHHPGVLDDVEHLLDAVVHVAEQPADGRGPVRAERQLAGRRGLDAHLVLERRW